MSAKKMYRRFTVAVAEKPILGLLAAVALLVVVATIGPYMHGRVRAISDRCNQQPVGQRGECLHDVIGKWQLLANIQLINFVLVSICAVAVVGTTVYLLWWNRHKAKLLAKSDWAEAAMLVAGKARRDSLVSCVSLTCLAVSALILAEAVVWGLLV